MPQCYSVQIGETKDGIPILEWICLCNMTQEESRKYNHIQDVMSIAEARLRRIVEYVLQKRSYHSSLGIPEWTLAQRRQFLASLPVYKPISSELYYDIIIIKDNPKNNFTSLNEAVD